jgi:hypothetical protein
MFGLLLPLTCTGTMSVALGAGATVREILLAARGCNIAWGLVDAAVYLLTSATEHGRGRAQAAAIRAASDPEAKAQLRALMPGRAGEALSDAQVGAGPGWMRDTPPEPDVEPVQQRQDSIAAGQVFLLVTGAAFPPILPFLVVESVPLAMRLLNATAVAMLVAISWRLDQQMQGARRLMRRIIPVTGLVMGTVTIALGEERHVYSGNRRGVDRPPAPRKPCHAGRAQRSAALARL